MEIKVRIGPIDYDLVEVDRLLDSGGTSKLSGHIKYTQTSVEIEVGLSEQAKVQTIWHEIIHGILTQSGLNEQSNDERLVEILANGVMSAVRDNAWLVSPKGGNTGRLVNGKRLPSS